VDLAELYGYRELFYFFAWRDLKVRYKQTAIGAAWAVIQPVLMMVVFTLFFHGVAKIGTGAAVPYAIFSYLGVLFWQYFSSAITRASSSLVDNQAVITKIYFPRIIPPVSSTLVALVDFLVATVVFAGLLLYYGISPGILGIALFIPAMLVTFVAAAGLGIFLAAVNVRYRDVKQAVPFLVQTGLFITPVIFPITQVPERFRFLLYLNPMTGVISDMRAALLHAGTIDWGLTAISLASAFVMLIGGLMYFRARERQFADII
jgi:lipopolysaccharide transport system permease protein